MSFIDVWNWGRDSRGRIATEFVLGGGSVKGNDDKYDGQILPKMTIFTSAVLKTLWQASTDPIQRPSNLIVFLEQNKCVDVFIK